MSDHRRRGKSDGSRPLDLGGEGSILTRPATAERQYRESAREYLDKDELRLGEASAAETPATTLLTSRGTGD